MFKGKKLRLIPALLAVAFSGGAFASGFQLLEQNASGIGNAYAGSAAVADNASTIFYNPAGMTQLKDREFSVGATGVQTSFKFSDQGSAALAGTGNGGDGGSLGFIPNGYLSWALNKDWYVGVGVGAPFGLVTKYNDPWIGGAHSLSFDIKTYNINPSVAYKVNDQLSVGLGLSWQRIEAEYKKIAGIGVPFSLTRVTLKLDDDSWGWNVGALYKVTPATTLGVSYRSQVKYDLTGNTKGSGGIAPVIAAATGDAKAKLTLPDTVIFSAAHKLNDRWELLGDVSWTGWNSIPELNILRPTGALVQKLDTKFRDTWRVAVGGNYTVNDAWKLKVGVAHDQTPIRDAAHRLASLPDNDRTWFSLGGQWKASKTAALDFGAAYLYVRDAKINNAGTSPLQGVVTGNYKDSAWLFGAQYSMAF